MIPALAAISGLVVGGVGGYGVGQSQIVAPTAEESPVGLIQVTDGADPVTSGCVPDANVVAVKTVEGIGTLKLLFSTTCNAYWAKLERHDGRAVGNKLEAVTFQTDSPSRRQRAVDPGLSSNYTFMLVRDDPNTVICASGSVWVDGVESMIPGPVC